LEFSLCVWLKESSSSDDKKEISFLVLNQLEKTSNKNKNKNKINHASINFNRFGNNKSNYSSISLDPNVTSSSTSITTSTTTSTTSSAPASTSFSSFSTSLSEQLKACSGPPPSLSLPCSERAIEVSWRECFSYQW
jgi:hypothetical protein